MNKELVVCYKDLDGQWLPFMHFTRKDLQGAVSVLRSLGHAWALNAEWCLKRKRRIICRIPR